MKLIYKSLIVWTIISMSYASNETQNLDDETQEEISNSQLLENDPLSPVIEQESLEAAKMVADENHSISSDRILELEHQLHVLRGQMEDLKNQVRKSQEDKNSNSPASMSSDQDLPALALKTKEHENISSDSLELSSFEQRPALKQYEKAQKYLEDQLYPEAEQALKDIIISYPKDPLVINAKYWLGETYFLQKNYKQAAHYFANAYEVYRDLAKKGDLKNRKNFKMNFAKAPEALLKLAGCLKILDKKKQACLTLDQLRAEFPHLSQNIKKSAEKLENELNCKAMTVNAN